MASSCGRTSSPSRSRPARSSPCIIAVRLHPQRPPDRAQLLHRHDPRDGRHVARSAAAGAASAGSATASIRRSTRTSSTSWRASRSSSCTTSSATPMPMGTTTTWTSLTLGVTFACGYVFVATALAGALLPFRAKGVYESSPGAAFKIGGIPVVTIVGVLGFIAGSIFLWLFLTNDQLGLTSQLAYTVVGGILVFSLLWYIVTKIVRRNARHRRRLRLQGDPARVRRAAVRAATDEQRWPGRPRPGHLPSPATRRPSGPSAVRRGSPREASARSRHRPWPRLRGPSAPPPSPRSRSRWSRRRPGWRPTGSSPRRT